MADELIMKINYLNNYVVYQNELKRKLVFQKYIPIQTLKTKKSIWGKRSISFKVQNMKMDFNTFGVGSDN